MTEPKRPGPTEAGPTEAGPTEAGPTEAGPTEAGPNTPEDPGAASDAQELPTFFTDDEHDGWGPIVRRRGPPEEQRA